MISTELLLELVKMVFDLNTDLTDFTKLLKSWK